MQIYVGTSGYQYAHWNNGVFYPRGIKDRLSYAFTRMNALEINSSFYSIPKPDTVGTWAAKIPDGAKMILKAPQSVSHRRRLKLHSDPKVKQGIDLLNYFIEGVLRIPETRRGPVLLQLPGRMEIDLARLEPVLELFASRALKVALEVRHASWFDPCALHLLSRYNAALVSSDWVEFATPLVQTADFLYVRRHGPTSMYASLYDEDALWADLALIRKHQAQEAYVLFNNDIHGYAPVNAVQMMRLLSADLQQGASIND
ncbi:DUF72 domain-containing protein [Oxalobacteraceae bacterium R-40]|uniref:DUF72 domain-containing protein n=1 Tax=Keguizhuia sedimenti TaxID=3064264 RepID=A0ABU1BK10_9BURK|nr:DUF72 domain-containing protein [Oxalobacteraceae bacterium R-40]